MFPRPGRVLGGQDLTVRLRPDVRKFAEAWDRLGSCRKCGIRLITLPDDRRQGYCFDCYESLEVRSVPA